jgi:hypothetical protein
VKLQQINLTKEIQLHHENNTQKTVKEGKGHKIQMGHTEKKMMINLNLIISLIILNVNSLNISIKRKRQSNYLKNKKSSNCNAAYKNPNLKTQIC